MAPNLCGQGAEIQGLGIQAANKMQEYNEGRGGAVLEKGGPRAPVSADGGLGAG